MKNQIPVITHPLGSAWDQPKLDNILIDDTHALMEKSDFVQLRNYEYSFPTAVYEGKMWRSGMYLSRVLLTSTSRGERAQEILSGKLLVKKRSISQENMTNSATQGHRQLRMAILLYTLAKMLPKVSVMVFIILRQAVPVIMCYGGWGIIRAKRIHRVGLMSPIRCRLTSTSGIRKADVRIEMVAIGRVIW